MTLPPPRRAARSMNLRFCVIAMTALAVVTDNLLIPFYPQYFAERFANPPSAQVGTYLAAISLVVMLAFPVWARLARRHHPVHLLVGAQFMAGVLTLACYFVDHLPTFWVVSLVMVVFKASYLLMYPYVMSLEPQAHHARTIGTLSVVVHFGAILGAAAGGLVLEVLPIGEVFLLMALGDFIQLGICLALIRRGLPAQGAAADATAEPPPGGTSAAIWRLCVVMLLFYSLGYVSRPFFAAFWQATATWNSELIAGAVYALPGLVAVVALWWSRRADQQGNSRDGILAGLLLGALGTLLQGVGEEALVLLGRLLFGWALYQVTVRLDALLFELSTPAAYAVDFSKINVFQCLGSMAGASGAGLLVDHFDLTMPFWVGAAGLALTALAFPLLIPRRSGNTAQTKT